MNAKRFAFAEERAKLFNNKKLIFIKNEIKKIFACYFKLPKVVKFE
jgi:hypothetical protein